jgi:hypothetical protein
MKRMSPQAKWLWSSVCLVGAVACTPARNDYSTDERAQQSASGVASLSAQEMAEYQSNFQYLRSLVKSNRPVQLNFADPKQWDYYLARLKMAGKTAKTAPYLFQRLEELRKDQITAGHRPGSVIVEPAALDVNAAIEQFQIEGASLGETTEALNDALGEGSTTYPGGSYATGLDVLFSTTTGSPLGEIGYEEEYADADGNMAGTNLAVEAAGDLSRSNIKRYVVSANKFEETDDGIAVKYTEHPTGYDDLLLQALPPTLAPVNHVAPADIRFNDGKVSVCLNRTWTQDCDYDLTGNPQAVKLPLVGSVQVTSPHMFDQRAVNAIRTQLASGVAAPNSGSIKLILTFNGGGCDMNPGGVGANMLPFWNSVRISPDGKTFSWDLSGANAAHFADGCRQVQSLVKLTATIPLPLQNIAPLPAGTAQATISISSDPATLRPDVRVPPITVTNSCLAAGTQVAMAGGKVAAIETLRAGQEVLNHFDRGDGALTIVDTSIGTEPTPMVRIRDEAGRTLLMTEMHPISTPDRGMVTARALATGDVVLTVDGPSKLVEVSREAYAGKVYNLKVGDKTEAAALAPDQTVMYANGFVVGDGQIQSKHEAMATQKKASQAPVIERWRRDAELSSHKK